MNHAGYISRVFEHLEEYEIILNDRHRERSSQVVGTPVHTGAGGSKVKPGPGARELETLPVERAYRPLSTLSFRWDDCLCTVEVESTETCRCKRVYRVDHQKRR